MDLRTNDTAPPSDKAVFRFSLRVHACGRVCSALVPQALGLCCVTVWCVPCSSLVVSVMVVKLEGERRQQWWLIHADLLCCPPSSLEGLLEFFHLREHPQTAEPDKPPHFAVTSLGFNVRVGLVVQVWWLHPTLLPLPSLCHPRHPPK